MLTGCGFKPKFTHFQYLPKLHRPDTYTIEVVAPLHTVGDYTGARSDGPMTTDCP